MNKLCKSKLFFLHEDISWSGPVTMLRPLLLLVPCLLALGWDMDDLHARGHLDRDIPGFDQEFEVMGREVTAGIFLSCRTWRTSWRMISRRTGV